jgi:Cysteine-rich secretory protein family
VRAGVVIVIALTLVAVGFALWPRDPGAPPDPCGPTTKRPSAAGIAIAGQTTLCLLNRERTERGLPALRENNLLSAASLEHSRDMVQVGYFEHTSADGRSVSDRLRAVGYSRGISASAGENIAYGVGGKSTPASIVQAWMHSPGHRADILRPAFTEIGIGIALGAPEVPEDEQGDSATYTTDFGGVVDPSLPNR